MHKQSKYLKMLIVTLCVILILAYAFIMFLPHFHECIGFDCAICNLIRSSRNILIGTALSASFFRLTKFTFVILNTQPDALSYRDATPVGLKVKLSD